MAPAPIPKAPAGTLKTVCEAIWSIERDLGLFEQQIDGIFFWRLIRWETCRALTQRIDRDPTSPPRKAGLKSDRVDYELSALRKRALLPSWRDAGRMDTVLVPFPRKQVRLGGAVDMHSMAVLEEPALGNLLVLERTDAAQHTPRGDRLFVADRDRDRPAAVARALTAFPRLLGPFAPVRRALDEACRRRLGMAFPLSLQSLAGRTALFAENRRVFRRLLRDTGAKRFMAAWQDQAMFAAAQDLGLPTVELQHAAFSAYNPHYHFPAGGLVPYFAERFLVFAPYWMDHVTLPSNTRASVIGSANIAALRRDGAHERARRVIIPSQGPTYWPLFNTVLEAAIRAPNWDFVFRPHPRENLDAYQARLASGPAPSNLRLSPASEDLYELIRTADVQIGLASTALFEGMSLGCRTIIFDSPMSAGMNDVITAGDAIRAGTASEILSGLETAPATRQPDRYYASPTPIMDALGL